MRRGLTLVELVMVILILAIVAGGVSLLVGRLPTSTSVSTSAGTISQAARAVQQFRSFEGRYPSRLDLLLADHTNNGVSAALTPDLNANGFLDDGVPIGDELSVISSNATLVSSLRNAGISQVIELPDTNKAIVPGSNEPQTVFRDAEPDNSTRVVDLIAGTSPEHFVVLGADAIDRLGLDGSGTSTYVVFGLGNNCELVGETILSAPIHTRQEQGAVVDRYARFLVVFRVEGTTVSLATIATLEPDTRADGTVVATVTGVGDYLQTFYATRNSTD
ncbi:MAG: type II secretion system protein [Planctomycetota bacterium]